MFENSGEKIRSVAKVVFAVNVIIICVMLIGAFIAASNMRYGGGEVVVVSSILIAIIVFIVAWVTSLFMVAFGDLVESNEEAVNLLKKIKDNLLTKKNESNNQLGHVEVDFVQPTNIIQFCDLIEKYELGKISKGDLVEIKKDNWFKICQTFKNSTSLEQVKMRKAFEHGLISKEEYEAFYYATK